jgi:hypothetical protein
MKKIFPLLLIVVAFSFSTCDKIEAPYREEVVAPDFCATGIDDSIPSRKVLVEDYTGHLCGNCPYAGIYLNDSLKSIYNHCLVVISVHAGFFAGVCPGAFACLPSAPPGSFTTDFNTTPGSAWNTFFGISGNPKGMINRIDYPTGGHSKGYTAWGAAVATELEKPATAKIKITNVFNASTNSVSVEVQSDFVADLTGDYKLQVVITEDSLIDWQVWYPPAIEEFDSTYIHHHVLRDALNSTWGEDIATGSVTAGTSVTKNYSYTINSSWKNEHCAIVAFIYNAATYEIIQVEEASVK